MQRALSLAVGDGVWTPPPAPPATTVLLVRDGESGPETFLMRRAMTMQFAPGMVVFPGGRVDEADFAAQVLPEDFPLDTEAARASADIALTRALWACAVREVREETTVELADPLVDPESMTLISHWITPEVERHRYDVRFFMAALPAGQEARNVTTEADEAHWMPPADALAQCDAGRLPMLPPTRAALGFLRDHASIEQAFAAARNLPIMPLLPRPVLRQRIDGEPARIEDLHWEVVDARSGAVLASLGAPPPSEAEGTRG